jgi:hypothetical protein
VSVAATATVTVAVAVAVAATVAAAPASSRVEHIQSDAVVELLIPTNKKQTETNGNKSLKKINSKMLMKGFRITHKLSFHSLT